MSIKLTLLKSNEMVISDLKEVRSNDNDKLVAYLLNKPHRVSMQGQREVFLAENENHIDDDSERPVQITLTPWVFLTSDDDIVVTNDWIVTVMEPLEAIVEMYEEKVNGRTK